MKFYKFLLLHMGFPIISAFEGFYYQIFSTPFVKHSMQQNLSCITASFSFKKQNKVYYTFNGYNNATKSVNRFQGELTPNLKNNLCFSMQNYKNIVDKNHSICIFNVDNNEPNYIITTNGHFNMTMVLTKHRPDSFTSLELEEQMSNIQQTLAFYHLPTDLVKTNQEECFFYPPNFLHP